MGKKRLSPLWAALAVVLALVLAGWFLSGVLAPGWTDRSRELTYEAVRRGAVQCYAMEGAYPTDLAYLEEHYGVHVDEKKWVVDYRYVADNLTPDVTVLPVNRGGGG